MVDAPYTIKIAPRAAKEWLNLSAKCQRKLIKFFLSLEVNPRPEGVQKIEGMTGLYSQEVDHLRVVYKVLEQQIIVLIIK